MPYSKNIMSIDYLMYEISEIKDLKIKQIERVCKETAVDCALNKRRNLLAIDKDNTRECEYQSCNYVCDNVSDEYIQKKLELNLES
jgi:isocitrate/isopropylmalate dehydrogenase